MCLPPVVSRGSSAPAPPLAPPPLSIPRLFACPPIDQRPPAATTHRLDPSPHAGPSAADLTPHLDAAPPGVATHHAARFLQLSRCHGPSHVTPLLLFFAAHPSSSARASRSSGALLPPDGGVGFPNVAAPIAAITARRGTAAIPVVALAAALVPIMVSSTAHPLLLSPPPLPTAFSKSVPD